MRATIVSVLLLPAILPSGVRAEDRYVGTIWNVKVRSEQTGKYVDIEPIRCTTDGKVYREGRVIGRHKK
ncbi:MAG: hypothetical protein ACK58L_01430 [Planctomycetota bacterium]